MWTFEQRTGILRHNGESVGTGYSGYDAPGALGKNNPALQDVHEIGPIPEGLWRIGKPITHPELGPLAMPLTPELGTDAFGRSGFYIHGDSFSHPGKASHGCIILSHDLRVSVAESGDDQLQVVSGIE